MPRLPRDLSQARAIRAFASAGGVEIKGQGKGGHRTVLMPNGRRIVLPGVLKPGLLQAMIKQAGLTVEEFVELL